MPNASLRLLALLPVLVFACSGSGVTKSGPQNNTGLGVGADCGLTNLCRDGLKCDATSSKCVPGGTVENGKPCKIGGECASGACGAQRTCESGGAGLEGTSCGGDRDCAKGLRCAFDGTSFFPRCIKEGTKDYGEDCTATKDCFQGLTCDNGKCDDVFLPADAAPKGIPPYVPSKFGKPWTGVTCPAAVTTSPVTALFTIPRAADALDGDFYKIPFPNDALRDRATGKVSYANHPHDDKSPVGFDAVKLYLDALSDQPFGPYSTVYFRFDGEFDFDTVSLAGDDPQTRFVDLTAGAGFGNKLGLNTFVTNGGNRYICPNSVAVRPNPGGPLAPGGTYGVILKKGIKRPKAPKGDESLIAASKDFQAMVAGSAPVDPALQQGYAAYKPLRDYLAKVKIAPEDVINAAVFTVGDPRLTASRLRTSVRAATAPKIDAWVKCGAGAKSPCADADGPRACPATASADFDELHTLVEVPIFQGGTAPYLTSKDGGDIKLPADATSPIAPVRTEKVCMALTVPKGTAPAGGFPVVIYAHGTGGSFRSHADDGAAKSVSKIDLAGGTTVAFAMLGIDQVSHGTRRNGSKDSPNNLFFNFANPQAARFNAVQGAADQHTLVRLLETLTVDDGGTPVKLDPSRIVYWGHSQGSTEGALFLAYDNNIKGAVLSGEGAGLIDALVSKTSPVDIKNSLWLALEESGPGAVGYFHPVLSLLQMWADPSDPIHYGTLDVVSAGATAGSFFPRNLFQPYGTADTFSPDQTELNFAVAARLAWVGPTVDLKGTPLDSASGNVVSGTTKVTAAFRQYAPSGYDGHFVVFKNPTANADAMKFLARSSRGEVPKLPE